jgi:hypothetical protein
MSWDVTLCRFADGTPRIPDEEDSLHGNSLGTYDELRSTLSQILAIEWDETGWGTLTSPDFTIEFNMQPNNNSFDSLMLHIQEPEFAMHAVYELAVKLGWSVFDNQEGRFIDLNALTFSPMDDEDWEDADEDDEFSETMRRPQLQGIRYI